MGGGRGVERKEADSARSLPLSSLPLFPVNHLFLNSFYALTDREKNFVQQEGDRERERHKKKNKRSHRRNARRGITKRERGAAVEKVKRRYSRMSSTKAKEEGEQDKKRRGEDREKLRDREHHNKTLLAAGGEGRMSIANSSQTPCETLPHDTPTQARLGQQCSY